MIHTLLLLLATSSPATAPAITTSSAPRPVETQTPAKDDEYSKRKKEAAKDVTKLWKLYEWCQTQKKDKEAKATLKDILKIDPNHKEANIALGYLFFDGKWFENQKKIDEYKKQKEIDEKLAQGLVEYKGQWVPKEDVPFLEKGMVKDDTGTWVDAELAKKIKEGFVKQDMTWIPPAEKENIEKGLWKCGDKWLSLADADKYHSEIEQWWQIPCGPYVLWTTCDRDLALGKIKRNLDEAFDDLAKIYDNKPALPIDVMVLRSAEQYSSYAAGDEDTGRGTTDLMGLSSVHYSYFADLVVEVVDESPVFHNMGVAYWDAAAKDGDKWGVHAVRHAIGQSFGEALDPSPKALETIKKNRRMDQKDIKKYYEEKRVPRWFRYGAAAYVERYFTDTTVGIGGNKQWTREWSVKNILSQGGLRPYKQIFEFGLKSSGGQDATKLINESGLMIAFARDGGCEPVTAQLKAVQAVVKSGKDKKEVAEAVKLLEAEIAKHDTELRKFAGI